MESLLNRVRQLRDDELQAVSEAIDHEIERRAALQEMYDESARSRANSRDKSYRRTNGASAPPIYAAGLGKKLPRRNAA